MSINDDLQVPCIEIFGLEEIQRLALHKALRDRGIEDPNVFLDDHVVKYVTAFKANLGLAITITDIEPRQKKRGKPGTPEGV